MQARSGWPNVVYFVLFGIAVAASITAGLPTSPYFDTVLFWLGKIAGPAWRASPAVFHGTKLVLTLATLAIAAIPVLLTRWLASRWIGRTGQAAIWCLAAIALAWPALRIVAGFGD